MPPSTGRVILHLIINMEQMRDRDKSGESTINLVVLPAELLLHLCSFLAAGGMRDLVKMRYVSRTLRSVCETPSLWRDFTWSQFDSTEERCVRNVLKSFGEYIKRLSFPDHVMPSKLASMLKYCRNLVQLSIPTSRLSADQLGKAIESMRYLEKLDVPWNGDINPLLLISAKLKELTIREKVKKPTSIAPISYSFFDSLDSWMDKWVKEEFHPQTLNIVSNAHILPATLMQHWFHSNPSSLPGLTGCLKVYRRLRVPMDLFPALPEFQLQFGQSCTLPYVKASKCGLLGLERDLLLLTNCTDSDNVLLHRAKMVMSSNINEGEHLKNDMTSLTFVTHFDASLCTLLHSGHLEQLAMMCPNLHQLNLKGNIHCLKSLQGLRVINNSCSKLIGLNLLGIQVKDVESRVRLWEILVDLRLLYLAIELCVLLPYGEDDQTKQMIIGFYQNCSKLKALESYRGDHCAKCRSFVSGQSLLLSNFPSITHCLAADIHYNAVQDIVSSCKKLKYFRYTHVNLSCTLAQNCTLEQFCIGSNDRGIPDSFMDTVSAHGGLVHVVLRCLSVTTKGVTALIANSPKLMTCHIYAHVISSEGVQFNHRGFFSALKKKFPKRKLFSCGSCNLTQGRSIYLKHDALNDFLMEEHNTDLVSLWP